MKRRKGRFGRRMRRRPPFGRRGKGSHHDEQDILSARIRKELRRANHLAEQGDHTNAAVIFQRLADEAYDRNNIRRAPMLFLQAAHAFILAGKIEKGVDLGQKGLKILAEKERWGKLHSAGGRVIETLSSSGYAKEAEEIRAWLDDIRDINGDTVSDAVKPRGQLPTNCPHCGATIRSDEVSWIDKNTAECGYCGSAVQTE